MGLRFGTENGGPILNNLGTKSTEALPLPSRYSTGGKELPAVRKGGFFVGGRVQSWAWR